MAKQRTSAWQAPDGMMGRCRLGASVWGAPRWNGDAWDVLVSGIARLRTYCTLENLNGVLAGLIAALTFVWLGCEAGGAVLRMREAPTITVTVHRGDTLWKIATRYGNADEYVLRRVNRLATDNHIAPGMSLQPGMKLHVRVENPDEQMKLDADRAR